MLVYLNIICMFSDFYPFFVLLADVSIEVFPDFKIM